MTTPQEADLFLIPLLDGEHALGQGTWPVIGFETLPDIERVFKLNAAKANNFENVQIQDPAIIEAFVNACHGLYPWDAFPDPDFFDNLLIKKDARPATAKMKTAFDT